MNVNYSRKPCKADKFTLNAVCTAVPQGGFEARKCHRKICVLER